MYVRSKVTTFVPSGAVPCSADELLCLPVMRIQSEAECEQKSRVEPPELRESTAPREYKHYATGSSTRIRPNGVITGDNISGSSGVVVVSGVWKISGNPNPKIAFFSGNFPFSSLCSSPPSRPLFFFFPPENRPKMITNASGRQRLLTVPKTAPAATAAPKSMDPTPGEGRVLVNLQGRMQSGLYYSP